ncbi:MAG: glycosyltransferase family 9 protein [Candidatus Omnitrophica bacterium]|nr:glycosyltransferase family 9 protein [Candidatus Omnitrophota bacterium]
MKNILIVRTDRLGDLLMTLPMIRCIKQNYPQSKITLLSNISNKGLLEDCSDIDDLEYISEKDRKTFSAKVKIFKMLKAYKFDVAVISNPDKFFHFITWFSGIPLRVGYNKKSGFYLNKKTKDISSKGDRHQIDCNLDLAYLFCDRKWDGNIQFTSEHVHSNSSDLKNTHNKKTKVAVHLTTSNPIKEWPIQQFHEVCNSLKNKGYEIVLIGEKRDNKINSVFNESDGFIDLIGKTSLSQLCAVLKGADCLISLDSGPYHIAWMQKTPVVGIFIKDALGSNPIRWGVYPGYAKCKQFYDKADNITVEHIVDAVEEVIA